MRSSDCAWLILRRRKKRFRKTAHKKSLMLLKAALHLINVLYTFTVEPALKKIRKHGAGGVVPGPW